MTIQDKDKEDCCGCGVCVQICPMHAINMKVSLSDGFSYPNVDFSLCINCGLCYKHCQFSSANIVDQSQYLKCYALKHKDTTVISKSRSGGVFTALSDYILEKGGFVCGASLDSDFVVRHHIAHTYFERDRFRTSKYVQSDLGEVFNKIESLLKLDNYVLFSGTPCQSDALRIFLTQRRVSQDKLILVDLVCHGVPSPVMFKDYINWIEYKNKKHVKQFIFRDKETFSWEQGIEKIEFEDGSVKFQDYFTGDIFDQFIRPSCYKCKYTTYFRNVDFTLADYWGSERGAPEFTDLKNGCSLLLIHSLRAEKIFNSVKQEMIVKEVSPENCSQPNLLHPRKKSDLINKKWDDYKNHGFNYIIFKYCRNSLSFYSKLVRKLKAIKNKIKRLF